MDALNALAGGAAPAAGLAAVTRWTLVAGLLLVTGSGALMYRAQRAGRRIGGACAPAKSVWLAFVTYLWFVVAPALAFDPALGTALQLTFGVFAASMWVRGIVELYMLYATHSWRPAYGIAHDLGSIALLLGMATAQHAALFPPPTRLATWTLALGAVMVISLALETWYAQVFHRVVGDGTLGDRGLWFAAADDPRFTGVVRLTARANVVLIAAVVTYLVVVL